MKYNKYYPFLALVIGILILYYVNNTLEGFAASDVSPALLSVPNGNKESIYLLMKNPNDIKIVAPKAAYAMIDATKTKMESNMLNIVLKAPYNVEDFVAFGFGKNRCTSTTKNKDDQCWAQGIVDAGLTTISLLKSDGKLQSRNMNKGLSKLPLKAVTTFKIGPIGPTAFGGPTIMNINGDKANDAGKVSGPANVRIDLLLSK